MAAGHGLEAIAGGALGEDTGFGFDRGWAAGPGVEGGGIGKPLEGAGGEVFLAATVFGRILVMRKFNVLFAGRALSGRRTSLGRLTGTTPTGFHEEEVTAEVRTSTGETVLLHGRVPYFGSLCFETWEDLLSAEHGWNRVARSLLDFLPTIHGIIFVVDSSRLVASVRSLHQLKQDLSRLNLDLGRIPVVFQHNHRDRASAVSIEELMATFSTPRCAHVESVVAGGYGHQRAFDTLVQLCDDTTRPPVPPIPTPNIRTPTLRSPRMLFDDQTSILTCDGEVRASLCTTTRATSLTLGPAAVLLGWPKSPSTEVSFAEGTYAVEVAVRHVHIRGDDTWQSGVPRIVTAGTPRFVAARVHLPLANVVRREPLFDRRTFTHFVFVGSLSDMKAIEQDGIAGDAYLRTTKCGGALVERRGDRFELAERGTTAILTVETLNEAHVVLGRDSDDRIVELSCWGDDGAAMLARQAC